MKYDWLDGYLSSKTGAVKDFKVEWGVERYRIGDKMFCMIGKDKEGREIITLKCEPTFGQMLRKTYPDIVPGYYMNKAHWNSVDLAGEVPDEVIKEMIDVSYMLILNSLSKKLQNEILTQK